MHENPPKPSAAQREARITEAMALLTVTAGVVEATSFLALGQVFTAFATGNLLFLAFALAGQGIVPAGRPAVALIAFIVGVALGSAVIRALGRRRWFPMALVTEAVLLGVAGVVALRDALWRPA